MPCFSERSAAEVIITEIHYNPDGSDEQKEFIELKNVGNETADMSGWQFTNGVSFTFSNGTVLEPGKFFVVVANPGAFALHYPGVAIGGQFIDEDNGVAGQAGLANKGERLTLKDGPDETGSTVFSLRYHDGNNGDISEPPLVPDADALERARWPSEADGEDRSLVSLDPNGNPDEEDYRNWRPSINLNGSPGADEPLPSPLQVIYINEVRTRDGVLDNDAVELYNPGVGDVDIGGWFVSDNLDQPMKNPAITSNTIVPAGGYRVLENGVSGFILSVSSKGERVFLYSAQSGILTGWVHGFHLEASEDGKNFARFVDASGREHLIPDDPSMGAGNGTPALPVLSIIEIMHTPGYGSVEEYIKIRNSSVSTVALYDPLAPSDNLNVGGFGITLPGVQPTLAPGEEAFVTNISEAAFRAAYDVDSGARVFADTQGGGLNGGGELIELRMPVTIGGFQRNDPGHPRYYYTVDEVHYDDDSPWPSEADGSGYSLQKVDLDESGFDSLNWASSVDRGGSAFGGGVIYVNEVLSHTDIPQTDVIELHNPGISPVEIGGWYLTDDPLLAPAKYVIPAGTSIPAGGYWAVNEDNDANSGSAPAGYFGNAFSISSRGDKIFLFSGDGLGGFTGYAHQAKFKATANGVSIIRHVNSVGEEKFTAQSGNPSLEINRFVAFPDGLANTAPRVERAVISEILYDPGPGSIEFVEIANISGVTLALYDDTPIALGGDPGNNWELDGVDFVFPGNQPTLAANERVVIIPHGVSVAAFRNQYSVPDNVSVFGDAEGYIGALNNGGEELALLRPDKPDQVPGQGIIVPKIEVDVVRYDDDAPWPSGEGKSIERIDESAFGDDPVNWQTSYSGSGTPGNPNSSAAGYQNWAAGEFTEQELASGATDPDEDFNGDGYDNLLAYGFGFSPRLGVEGINLPQVARSGSSENDMLVIRFRSRIDALDLTYRVQKSSDLASWADVDNPQGEVVDNGDGTQMITHADPAAVGDSETAFLRVLLELAVP
ncbi:MAG: lamin tail domain-containing protein [Verrucomicrobiales bacterium]